ANSQCCPYMGEVYITPENPSATDSTYLITNVTTPNQGAYFGYEIIEMPDNNIRVEACYFEGFFTALQSFYDSINLGVLSDGNYTIDFVAFSSVNDLTCMPTDSNTVEVNFEVGGTSSADDVFQSTDISVSCFPNPVSSDIVRVVSEQLIESVEVFDAYGNVLLEKANLFSKDLSIDVGSFASGIYFIQVGSAENKVVRRLMKL
ncbi:MAG: T9SS type A sorting domain-containing protein, partial [Saprospiraceae bacterium]